MLLLIVLLLLLLLVVEFWVLGAADHVAWVVLLAMSCGCILANRFRADSIGRRTAVVVPGQSARRAIRLKLIEGAFPLKPNKLARLHFGLTGAASTLL